MARNIVTTLTTLTGDFVTTTTEVSVNAISADSTAQTDESEYTVTVSSSMLSGMEIGVEFLLDYSVSYVARIVECLGDGIYRVAVRRNTNDGSIGLSHEEAEL